MAYSRPANPASEGDYEWRTDGFQFAFLPSRLCISFICLCFMAGVQPVTNAAYELIVKMGQRGGLPNAAAGAGKKKEKEKAATATSTKRKEAAVEPPAGRNERNSKQNATKVKAETSEPENKQAKTPEQTTKTSGKRSAPQEQEHNDVEEQQSTRRRSARLKRE